MKRILLLVVVCLFSADSFAQTRRTARTPVATPSASRTIAQTLPIRRVILYSNGVAYIERRGTVSGRAEVNLSFKQSQVDDVLKSMVVLDLGQGRIGAVSYNSSAPPSARLADIPFSIRAGTGNENHGGLAGVLGQLQGARVVVSTGNRTAIGSILTVEERKPAGDQENRLTTYALVIASENGELMSFNLSEVRSIKLVDEGTRRDVKEFADASASARRRDAKTIVVTSDGGGTREMLVSYTIAAPIWKTTYRVVLDSSGKPFFQGWAIVDNVSEEDWNNISLSLVSGSPVSFIHQIQKPFYRYRPVIGMQEDLRLSPQTYEDNEGGSPATISGSVTDPNGANVAGATVTITNIATNQSFSTTSDNNGIYRSPTLAVGTYTVTINSAGFKQHRIENVAVGGSWPSRANVTLQVGSVSETVTITSRQASELSFGGNRPRNNFTINGAGANNNTLGLLMSPGLTTSSNGISLSDAITRPDSGVEAAATGSEVGDLFEYHIDQAVTVPRDRSALIPILQTRMEGERVSIYNQGVRTDRAFGGILLKNTSPLTLEDGAMTVIDGDAYAGEALMARLKPAEQRLISFALDLGTLVHVRVKEDRAPTFLVRAKDGVFQAHYYQTSSKTYVFTNQTDKPRVVIVEHPLRQDWTLSDDTPTPDAKSARFYRFRVKLPPHQKVELPVTERRVLMETYTLSNFTRDDLELFIARKYIDASTRAALEKIIDVRSRMAMAQARIETIDAEVEEIGKDQERLRDNIKALTATAEAKQLITRYVAKADTQETRLEQLNKEKQGLIEQLGRLQAELEVLVRGLMIEQNL
jgi:Carboxypeptidase regulatory-like domain